MMTIDWDAVAKRLGYTTEYELWKTLYLDQKLSITTLAGRFGISNSAVRSALMRCKIPMRGRGGPNRRTVDPPGPLDLEQQVERDGVQAVAKRLGLSPSGVYKRLYRRRRPDGGR